MEFIIHELPGVVKSLLRKLDSPSRLTKHLQIVHSVTFDILTSLKKELPQLDLNNDLILFGSATHDIGKIQVKSELFEPGNKHEKAGQALLLEFGFSAEKSRFAYTHGNWQNDAVNSEDLFVSLADKVWKGKRIDKLEEKLVFELANITNLKYWNIYKLIDTIISRILLDTNKRLWWQNKH